MGLRKFPWVMDDRTRSAAVATIVPQAWWFVRHKMNERTVRALGGEDEAVQILLLEAFQAAEDANRRGAGFAATCVSRWLYNIPRLVGKSKTVSTPALNLNRADYSESSKRKSQALAFSMSGSIAAKWFEDAQSSIGEFSYVFAREEPCQVEEDDLRESVARKVQAAIAAMSEQRSRRIIEMLLREIPVWEIAKALKVERNYATFLIRRAKNEFRDANPRFERFFE